MDFGWIYYHLMISIFLSVSSPYVDFVWKNLLNLYSHRAVIKIILMPSVLIDSNYIGRSGTLHILTSQSLFSMWHILWKHNRKMLIY